MRVAAFPIMKFIFILLVLLSTQFAFGSPISLNEEVKTVASAKYISHRSQVIHSASDKKGNLWIANNFGLFFENSYTSSHMDQTFGIPGSEEFEAIYYDEFEERILLLSNHRVLLVNPREKTTAELDFLGLSDSNRLLNIYFDETNLAFITNAHQVIIDRTSGVHHTKRYDTTLKSAFIDKTNNQIFALDSQNRIYSLHPKTAEIMGEDTLVDTEISQFQHHQGRFYARSECNILAIEPTGKSNVLYEQPNCNIPTQFALIDSRMLILHHNNLYIHELGSSHYQNVEVFDQSGRQFDTFVDATITSAEDGNILIDVEDIGVLAIHRQFLFNDQHRSLDGSDVSMMLVLTPGFDDTLWVSSVTGLTLVDEDLRPLDSVQVADEVTRMTFISKVYLMPDGKNVLLISQTEVFLYDTQTRNLEKYYERKSDIIETAFVDNGDLFILDGDTIYRKDYQTKTLISFQDKLPNAESVNYLAATDSEHVVLFTTTTVEVYNRERSARLTISDFFDNDQGSLYDISANNGQFHLASDTYGVAVFELDDELNLVNEFVYSDAKGNAPFRAVGLIRQARNSNATWYLGSTSWVRMSHNTQIPVLLSMFYEHTRTRVVSVAETNNFVYFTDRNYVGKVPAKFVTELEVTSRPNLSMYKVTTPTGSEDRLFFGNHISLSEDEVLHSFYVNPSSIFNSLTPEFQVRFPNTQSARSVDQQGYIAAPNLGYGESVIEITGIAGGLEVAPIQLFVHRDTPFIKSTLFIVFVISVLTLAVVFIGYILFSSYNRNAQLSKSLSLTQKCFSGTGLIQFAIDQDGTVLAKNLQAETTFNLKEKHNIYELIDDTELSQKWASAITSVCNIGEWNGALKLKSNSSLLYNRLSLAPETNEPVIVISMTPFENIIEGNSVADTYTRFRALLELYALERKSKYFAVMFRPIFENKAKDVDMHALQSLLKRKQHNIFPNGYFSNMYDKDLGFVLQANNATDLSIQIVKIKQIIESVCDGQAQLFCGGIQLSNTGATNSGEILSKMDHQLQNALDNNTAFHFEDNAVEQALLLISEQTISGSVEQESPLRLEPIIEQSSGAAYAMKVKIVCNNFQTFSGHALSIDNCKSYLEHVQGSLDDIAKVSESKIVVIDIPFTLWVYEQDYCEKLFAEVDTKNYRHRIAFNIKYTGESYNLTFTDLLERLELYACKVFVTLDLNDRYRFESVTDVRVDMCIVEMQQSSAYLSLLDGFTSFARLAGKDICLSNTTNEKDILLKNKGINYFVGAYFGQPVSIALANTLHESNFAHLVNDNRVKL